MSVDRWEQDRWITFGNPWHGQIKGATLVISETIEVDYGSAPSRPDTHLVQFSGIPAAPTPTAADVTAGRRLDNYAILSGNLRKYGIKTGVKLGAYSHVYLTADGTRWHIVVDATTVSQWMYPTYSGALPIVVKAQKATGSGLATAVELIDDDLAFASPGPSYGGYWTVVSTFSPNGKRLGIAIHGFSSTDDANTRDTRRSGRVAGVWEVVLSGGDADDPPAAVLSQVINSADCLVTTSSDAGYLIDPILPNLQNTAEWLTNLEFETYTCDVDGTPNQSGNYTYKRALVNVHLLTEEGSVWGASNTEVKVIGIAYDAINALRVFYSDYSMAETSDVTQQGYYSESANREEEVITDFSNNVISWLTRTDQIDSSVAITKTRTTTWKLRVDSDVAATGTLIETADYSASVTMTTELDHAAYPSGAESDGSTSRTFNGSDHPDVVAISMLMSSNNTAIQLKGASSVLGYATTEGVAEGPGTITMDGDGLPWVALNPKTGDITTTSGWSWI